jgi:GNAT superfamily N-acetyltransferase
MRPPPWPKSLTTIRQATFNQRFLESSPAISRRGSWIVQALAGRIPIGYAWVVPMVGDDRSCYVEEVAVLSGRRSAGIGSALIVEAVRWMSSQGYESIGVSSLADAERVRRESWFVRLGFVDSGGGMFMAATQALA